jgi:hypothetical protein
MTRTLSVNIRRVVRWIAYVCVALIAAYIALGAVVLSAMLAPPERFGQFMKHMPGMIVWGALPASRMWLWARSGDLSRGDWAPDFTLRRQGQAGRVTLSAFRGQRPVVLVFGSYT